jgi:hypothetical protein
VSSAIALREESSAVVEARTRQDLGTAVRFPTALVVERCRLAIKDAESQMLGLPAPTMGN